ncbi:unnamed protein product, partial [Closterium sp. Naga37s-1]
TGAQEDYAAGRVTVSTDEIIDMAALTIIAESLPTGNWAALVDQTVPRLFIDLRKKSSWAVGVRSRFLELSEHLNPASAQTERLKIIQSNRYDCVSRYTGTAIEERFARKTGMKILVEVNEHGVHFFNAAMNVCLYTAPLEVVHCTPEGVVRLVLNVGSTFEVTGGEDIRLAFMASKGDGGGEEREGAGKALWLLCELDEKRELLSSLKKQNQELEERNKKLSNELV